MRQINVFILEDDPHRIQKFRQRFGSQDIPDDVTCVISATDRLEEARKLLTEVVYDLVLLDHDLADLDPGNGIIIIATPREETGYDIAHWLEQNPDIAHRHGKYLSHSLNKVGRDRIITALKKINIKCVDVPWLWEESIFWKHISIK